MSFISYSGTLQDLSLDSSQHVRSALASVIMGMAPVLGKVNDINLKLSVYILAGWDFI